MLPKNIFSGYFKGGHCQGIAVDTKHEYIYYSFTVPAPDYIPGDEIEMDFTFDEHAFVIQKGEKLRIDISSSAFPLYVRHTNNRGPFALQTTAKIAHNTVVLDKSSITLLVE